MYKDIGQREAAAGRRRSRCVFIYWGNLITGVRPSTLAWVRVGKNRALQTGGKTSINVLMLCYISSSEQMHVATVCRTRETWWILTLPIFSWNSVVPLSLWFITIHKLLLMIYKCGSNTWNAFFTVTQRGEDRSVRACQTHWGASVSDMANITFVKVTVWKQRSFRTQHIEVVVSKEWWSCS